MHEKQNKTPIFSALQEYAAKKIVPFHVPGHKKGKGLEEFTNFLGKDAMSLDLTCLPHTDNIINPKGVIKEAQELAAEAFGADHCFFLTNGTTSGIQAMIMTVCNPGDKIILPRNAHKSAFGGLILSGAVPIYVSPFYDEQFGISTGISVESVENALNQHPEAKAVFIVNPNYYGTTSNLKKIVEISHIRKIPVLVDEAHGGHFHLSDDLPPSAMEAGADLCASSTHKMLGSLTQSSMLFLKKGLINPEKVKSTLNISQTTSPSYLLLSSLDVARKQAAVHGKEVMSGILTLTAKLREEIYKIKGFRLYDEKFLSSADTGFDVTKVTVNVQEICISGYEAEKLLLDKHGIQAELSDLYNLMFLITMGDTKESIEHLVYSLKDISAGRRSLNLVRHSPPWPAIPPMSVSPRQARYSVSKTVSLNDSPGEISAETIMAYPPGIPLICPGEYITSEIIDYVNILKREQAELQGTEDPDVDYIKVLKTALSIKEGEAGSAG